VIAKDLFTVFRREGLLDPAPASRYRRAILEPGGSAKAASSGRFSDAIAISERTRSG
jgi:hypothetical protein